MKVFRCMFVRRRVAAPHMPALHAHPQMHPPTTNLQTILTTLRRRLHLMNMVQMNTLHRNTFLHRNSIPPIRCVIPPEGAKPFAPPQPRRKPRFDRSCSQPHRSSAADKSDKAVLPDYGAVSRSSCSEWCSSVKGSKWVR